MPEEPFLRVVRGRPTPEELAALIMVLNARAASAAPAAEAAPESDARLPAWIGRMRPGRPRCEPEAVPDGWRVAGWTG
ncbi:hypothetical protein Sru01_11460 [Sphaerisporangium rufum]|uniref:Acyl-CoA carboxylase subunit epsilon n=1 Tax=Sphaerisporangium rufum TaxID=1381558 RepID=A0A919QXW8_9ACTN|nr:acyl-CoA carboxylase subunit epsilon [Sphaerisporangium rufum]GII76164.1 hypothetical protein Sru01_11460 [Sphaerisporangium rufum]